MNFKKLGGILIVLSVFSMTACNKTEDVFDYEEQFEKERPIIEQYAAQHLPEAIYDENSGIWYQVIDPGESGSYDYQLAVVNGTNQGLIYPRVTIQYEGKLLDGTVFDQNDKPEGIEFPLNGLIQAWHIAFFPTMINETQVNGLTDQGLQKGAEIRIITPSLWGYGNEQRGSIPRNSPLDFTIKVLDIKE